MKTCPKCKAPLWAKHQEPCDPGLTVRHSDRHPRLAAAGRWAASLSYYEMESVFLSHEQRNPWAVEAVNHYGGVGQVLRMAWRLRAEERAERARLEITL